MLSQDEIYFSAQNIKTLGFEINPSITISFIRPALSLRLCTGVAQRLLRPNNLFKVIALLPSWDRTAGTVQCTFVISAQKGLMFALWSNFTIPLFKKKNHYNKNNYY